MPHGYNFNQYESPFKSINSNNNSIKDDSNINSPIKDNVSNINVKRSKILLNKKNKKSS